MQTESFFKRQIIPLSLTVLIFGALVGVLYAEICVLNLFTPSKILLQIHWVDVLVGLTIYLKTSIDFAIFIGQLMARHPGWKGRVAIEIGTAVGNAVGTFAVLLLWAFFKEVRWLLAIMIFFAALVLFKLAEDSLEHAKVEDRRFPDWFRRLVSVMERGLERWNKLFAPLIDRILPNVHPKAEPDHRSFWSLFGLAFTIPFLLGLDDFAGYVPLFSIVNVFGFAIGVFAGHMLLNICLYISPTHTTKIVKNPVISLIGSIVFVGLAIWGFVEVGRLLVG